MFSNKESTVYSERARSIINTVDTYAYGNLASADYNLTKNIVDRIRLKALIKSRIEYLRSLKKEAERARKKINKIADTVEDSEKAYILIRTQRQKSSSLMYEALGISYELRVLHLTYGFLNGKKSSQIERVRRSCSNRSRKKLVEAIANQVFDALNSKYTKKEQSVISKTTEVIEKWYMETE